MSATETPPRKKSSTGTRVVSAIILGVVVLALTWLGATWFRLFAAIMAALMLYEWLAISRGAEAPLHRAVCWLAMAAAAVAIVGWGSWGIVGAVIVAGLGATVASGLATKSGMTATLGLVYATVSAFALASLRSDTLAGLELLVFLFAVVWSTDVFAYFVGRAVGGPKLAPSISPGKTWSGALGGTGFAIAAALVYSLVTGAPALVSAGVALVLSVISQIGDLAESAAKRRFGVKDSGWMIPGHGGVLDRVDGLVAAGIALYVIVVALAAFGAYGLTVTPP